MINALGFFPTTQLSTEVVRHYQVTCIHWLKVKRVQELKKCLQAFVVKVNVTPPKKVFLKNKVKFLTGREKSLHFSSQGPLKFQKNRTKFLTKLSLDLF